MTRRINWAALLLACFFVPSVHPLDLRELLFSGACSFFGTGTISSISCGFNGTLFLTGPWPNTDNFIIVVIVGKGPHAVVQLMSEAPLIISAGSTLIMQHVTVANTAFADDAPLDPTTSLQLRGIHLLPGASLILKSSTLSGLNCSAWAGLVQAVCDLGLSPGNAQYSEVRERITLVEVITHACSEGALCPLCLP